MNYIQFTPQSFEKFIQNYTDAVSSKKDTFVFDGEIFVTNYAKYLIEYYTTKIQQK
jgi:hypothetical protein